MQVFNVAVDAGDACGYPSDVLGIVGYLGFKWISCGSGYMNLGLDEIKKIFKRLIFCSQSETSISSSFYC